MTQNATDEKKEPDSVRRLGIDYAIKLSYNAIDKSNLADKRGLLYSLVCFGCLFCESFATDPDPIVKKYNCLSFPEPKKWDLYELAFALATLENADTELKKTWFMTFAYVILSEAPHNDSVYRELKKILCEEKILSEVLRSKYSLFIPVTEEEIIAQGYPALLADWYSPYITYCTERDEKGVTRETNECKRLLAAGNFDEALYRSERLLAAFPDDEQVAVTNIAARVSLSGATDKDSRTEILKETLAITDEYMEISDNKYFRYYRALTLLGLSDIEGARQEFEQCLEKDPSFELASFMLKAMDKYGADSTEN